MKKKKVKNKPKKNREEQDEEKHRKYKHGNQCYVVPERPTKCFWNQNCEQCPLHYAVYERIKNKENMRGAEQIHDMLIMIQGFNDSLYQAEKGSSVISAAMVHVLRWCLGIEWIFNIQAGMIMDLESIGMVQKLRKGIRKFRLGDFASVFIYEKT